MCYTKKLRLFVALLLLAKLLPAQEVWNLQRCVEHAQQNNLTIKQAQAQAKLAVLSEKQAKASRLPNVNGSGQIGQNFGRTIDPSTNSFSNTGIAFNSFGINAGANVYAGGQIHNQIKQANFSAQAAKADAEQTTANLALQVAQAYLNILLTEEQTSIARKRVEQSKRQLDNTQKLIDAGTLPVVERYTLMAQIARDEQNAVTAQNNADLAYLALKQLMLLEPDYALTIERPNFQIPITANPEAFALPTIYSTAVQTQASIRAADLRIKSAEAGIKVAKSNYLPQIAAFANLNTNFSSQFLDFDNPRFLGTFTLGATRLYRINDQDIPVREYRPDFEVPKIAYFDQLNRNFGQGFGARITVPIYQNGQVQLAVERARLNVLTAQTQNQQVQQQLKNDIQTSIANARAGKQQLEAAQKSVEATRTAYANIEKRFAIGSANTLELTTAKNNLDIAENDLVVARYNYLFRLKIIDFYEGKTLSVN
jgi:outer membrane protein